MGTIQNKNERFVYLGLTIRGEYALLVSDLSPEQIREKNLLGVLTGDSFSCQRDVNIFGNLETICKQHHIILAGDSIELGSKLVFDAWFHPVIPLMLVKVLTVKIA